MIPTPTGRNPGNEPGNREGSNSFISNEIVTPRPAPRKCKISISCIEIHRGRWGKEHNGVGPLAADLDFIMVGRRCN
jgi:hypothetical protein